MSVLINSNSEHTVGSGTNGPWPWVALALALPLLAANGVLLYQVDQAKSQILALKQANSIQAGQKAPPLIGTDLAGSSRIVNFGPAAAKTLIFVLSPSCSICNRNWSNWQTLIKGWAFRPIFVDLSDQVNPQYAAGHGIVESSLITRVSGRTAMQYHFGSTPETVLIGRDGRIEGTWGGFLAERALANVENFLSRP